MKMFSLKKVLFASVILMLLIAPVGCKDKGEDQPAPPPFADVPTAANQPNTMKIDELMGVVNTIVEFDEGYEFSKEYAEVWDDVEFEDFDDIVYYFDRVEYEAGLFADRESDCFKLGYFRLLWDDDSLYTGMVSIAGAFLMALEPNEYERMLIEVLSAQEDDGSEEDYNESVRNSQGEFWTITATGRTLINIYPNEQ